MSQKVGRNTITKAVQYCIQASFDETTTSIRPEHMERFSENILDP